MSLLFGILAGALAVGVYWAYEPLTRVKVLFEAPVVLQAGTVVRGRFLPASGSYALELVFKKEDPLDALGDAIGGGWDGPDRPAGVHGTYVLRIGEWVREGTTREQLRGWFGQKEVGVTLESFRDSPLATTDFEVRIDRASPALLSRVARLRVCHVGDWIAYNHIEAAVRGALVALGLLAVGAVLRMWLLHGRGAPPQSGS